MKHNLQQTINKRIEEWGLAEDISQEHLLHLIEKKLSQSPDDPELGYLHAELLRKTGRIEEATQAYQQVVDLTAQRTDARGQKLADRVRKSRSKLRKKLILFAFIPVLLIGLITGYYWSVNQKLEVLKKQDGNPNEFAFTHWLAKQQAAKIISNLQATNPNLSFDFGSNATKAGQDPMEFMQSLLGAEMQKKLRRGDSASDGNDDGDDGKPKFSCAYDQHIPSCNSNDVPSAPGKKRTEVVLLMNAYRSILNTEKNCEKLEQSIDKVGEQLKWRKSEKSIKADMEDYAIECFYRQNNHQKVIEHARKLQCAEEPHFINSVYWYLTASEHQSGNTDKAVNMYNCFNKAIEHKEKYYYDTASVAARHRESGALAWLYFNDLDTAVSELEKARKTIKESTSSTQMLSYVASEIDLDLMETYVTANIELDKFEQLHFDINSSGYLTDGYKQIKDTLAGIFYMQNGKNTKSVDALKNVIQRFKQMPEYICSWDWSGFHRGLETSIPDDELRKKAKSLVVATNCYVPQSNAERIQKINAVINSLR
ncbi:MAG TPA: tetratricopeptide repeat protein [Leucothrix mucor]|uniref:Tetratricopeptide repeat protein n=1 Tax=Leucothrix mucor TaxID=45248 RepID=A0A7V2T4E8_LEUMU|nr:tetratricopeptide repeat protein [Leucothrix mucor]